MTGEQKRRKLMKLIEKYKLVKDNYYDGKRNGLDTRYGFVLPDDKKVMGHAIGIDTWAGDIVFARQCIFHYDNKNMIQFDFWETIEPKDYEKRIKTLYQQYNDLKLILKKKEIQTKLDAIKEDFA